MSGIVAIVNLDHKPAEAELLRRLTDFLTFRGPDAQRTWMRDGVGLGHAMLRTTHESLHESQPRSLDGKVWITADARVDGREDLLRQMGDQGPASLDAVTDAELILHAYGIWGERCVDYLLGDFAFAIWDEKEQRLFCARDHFGVKPFYYAQVGNGLIISNTLNCVRLHPAVSDRLDELSVADILLFDGKQDPSKTVFADIQRLPPAHTLTYSRDGIKQSRFWAVPTGGFIRYRQPAEYGEHFTELFFAAVKDRLRTDSIGVFMSGGLDSTSIAAIALEMLRQQAAPFDLRAYTVVYDQLIPDRERYYSGIAAKALGIDIQYLVGDEFGLYEQWDQPRLHTPEPSHDPLAAISVSATEQVAKQHRVALSGQGGDPGFNPSLAYFDQLIRRGGIGYLVKEFCRYFLTRRQIPKFGVREWLRSKLGRNRRKSALPYPGWFNKQFAKKLELQSRWEQVIADPQPIHPIRPEAYQSLSSSHWSEVFESRDPGMTSVACESRYPFFDRRLITYLLAIPPIPWCVQKDLLRTSMRSRLPEQVRRRAKAPLAGDPYFEHARNHGLRVWQEHFNPVQMLANYVESDRIPRIAGNDPYQLWVNLRPISFNYWLKRMNEVDCNPREKETDYGFARER